MFVTVRLPLLVVRIARRGLRNGHHKATVLDAFEADEAVGESLDARGSSVDNQDFEAGVVIEVGMAGGDNEVVMLVLEVGEFVGDAAARCGCR